MTARSKRWRRLRPAASIHRCAARHGRSAPGTSEQRSFDSALRQHRHDAVGEIDRVAAPRRLAVEGAARRSRRPPTSAIATTMCQPPRICRIRVGLGPDRVVEVARIAAVDRDQRHLAQIGAAGRRRRRAALGLGERAAGTRPGCRGSAMAIRLIAPARPGGPSRSRMRARLEARRPVRGVLGRPSRRRGAAGIVAQPRGTRAVPAVGGADSAAVGGAGKTPTTRFARVEHPDDSARSRRCLAQRPAAAARASDRRTDPSAAAR